MITHNMWPMIGAPWLAAVALAAPCHELYLDDWIGDTDEDHEVSEILVAEVPSSDAECRADADCTLRPAALTCCGECAPAPPFEAVPETVVDAMLIDLETACAMSDRLCEPPVCEPTIPGCDAVAVCNEGRCQVHATGCEPSPPVSRL